mmetsp:Transcript_34546/g.71311  ORF Transcript_34546/g.71311 Transcript_34546/m.71311 type:complete len:262 (+) Transcript_34546:1017-1802(+)
MAGRHDATDLVCRLIRHPAAMPGAAGDTAANAAEHPMGQEQTHAGAGGPNCQDNHQHDPRPARAKPESSALHHVPGHRQSVFVECGVRCRGGGVAIDLVVRAHVQVPQDDLSSQHRSPSIDRTVVARDHPSVKRIAWRNRGGASGGVDEATGSHRARSFSGRGSRDERSALLVPQHPPAVPLLPLRNGQGTQRAHEGGGVAEPEGNHQAHRKHRRAASPHVESKRRRAAHAPRTSPPLPEGAASVDTQPQRGKGAQLLSRV